MSFKLPLLILLLCLCVVSAQYNICNRSGGQPCPNIGKREQLKRAEIIDDAAKKPMDPLWKLGNKRSNDFVQMKRMLYEQKEK